MNRSLRTSLLERFVLTIDGPAGAGKSSTARRVAERMGWRHLDTGAMYRAVAWAALREGIDPANGEALGALARSLSIRFEGHGENRRVKVGEEDVTSAIRSPEVTRAVSPVSVHPQVRDGLVRLQRRLAFRGGVVLEGRDTGSVVAPWADLRVYLDASVEERARRRHRELAEQGRRVPLEALKREIEERDRFDRDRETSPLRIPVGAWVLDTTELTLEEQVEAICRRVEAVVDERIARVVPRGRRTDRLKIRWDYRAGQFLIRTVFRTLFGLRVRRLEPLDLDENYIFACNHLSYADPPMVGSVLPREVHFLAKAELFRNRLFGGLIRRYNAIPLRRGAFDRRAMQQALELLNRGRSILIFPEGQRVRGEGLGPPRSGVGFLALHSRVPVVPLFVRGTNRLPRCRPWNRRLLVVQGRPIRLSDPEDPRFHTGRGYRLYARMVMAAIEALSEWLEEAEG
jgi:cytidylate kinase